MRSFLVLLFKIIKYIVNSFLKVIKYVFGFILIIIFYKFIKKSKSEDF